MNVAVTMNDTSQRRWRLPVAWLILIVFDLSLVALVCAQDPPPLVEVGAQVIIKPAVVQLEGPNNVAPGAERFEAIDVFVDPGGDPLAAYQFELQSLTPGVEIVGIEGGEHAAFADPPYYDRRAMSRNRVIIAAFHAGKNLPDGRSRVARIHVLLRGPGLKEYETKLTVSATVKGQKIPAEASVVRSEA